ncbi:Hsp20/alpha crystallin family protein [Rubripirellula reticaptiva]|uniref:Spore protein SP21 n=1 Tax=Rubripirellula reticaptiva TaxID=2528013 RepID=A0A5C6EJW0_9BACT|nr:Hsp20/alpha crystallin family protein [Rubripirellula reticaptiva]TWU47921.1 Spore protein SP21 [Rubripirellula reticaptiva]
MSPTMTTPEKQSGENGSPETTYQSTFIPRFDIWEGEEELLLYGDLPGVSVDDLDIRFENRELSIRGKVQPRHEGERLLDEYGIGDFHRTFTVGEAIDAEKISAEMKQGVLVLHLPKSEKLKPRRIKVKAI